MGRLTPQTNTDLADIARELAQRDDFVLCGHVSPDGDCLGSQLALASVLRSLGKDVVCVLAGDDDPDSALSFLPGIGGFVPASQVERSASTFVALDVPIRDRLGHAVRLLDAADFSVTIDHHAADVAMTDLVYVDPEAPATAALVWELAGHLVDEIPSEAALCAFTGLATDTGFFQYQNAGAEAFSLASSMISSGAEPTLVAREVFQRRTLPSVRLEQRVYDRMEFLLEGRAVVSFATCEDMVDLQARKSDTEVLVDSLRKIEGVEVAVMLREQDGIVRGSARAKTSADVSVLARKFDGGGHRAAAGFSVDVSDVRKAVALVSRELVSLYGSRGPCALDDGVRL